MSCKYPYFILLLIIVFSCQNPSKNQIAENIEALTQAPEMDSSLTRVYVEAEYKPIWVKAQGLNKKAEDFLAALDGLVYDGLDKSDYLTEDLFRLIENIRLSEDPAEHAALDLAFSKSFLDMASDLTIGKINPETTGIEWKMDQKSPTADFGEMLLSIANGNSVEDVFDQLRPQNIRYRELRAFLVSMLDPSVEEAEGVNLLEEKINRSDLIAKIKVNLERLRWLPDFTNPETDKIIVNIPDFHLFYVEGEDTVFTSKVVVGNEYRQTPVFKAEMGYLVFSPTWTLPETILWEDVIPSIQDDVDYLKKNDMKVLDYQEKEVDYREIDWDELETDKGFPYLIRQSPGTSNPLGSVKFMFPNEYSIYIHDTPAKGLFSREERTFSSGCIRMENAVQFAELLLEESDDWDAGKMNDAMDDQEETRVDLDGDLDVWILYLTVWGGGEDIQIREDVYDMDRKIAHALNLSLTEDFF